MPNELKSSNFGQVAAQFSFCIAHFNSKTTEPIFTIFLHDEDRLAINAHISKAMMHFVSEHESKE